MFPPPSDSSASMEEPAPTCREVSAKASLEILGLLVLILPMAYVYVFSSNFEPFYRYCEQQQQPQTGL